MVYNFLCKDEKTRRNIYLLLLKTSVWKEVRHFFRTVYPNRNHVTTHPDIDLVELNWPHLFSLQPAKVVNVAMCMHILRRNFDRNLSSILSRSSLPVFACLP